MSQSKNRKLRRTVYKIVGEVRERDPRLSLDEAVDVTMRAMLKSGVSMEELRVAAHSRKQPT